MNVAKKAILIITILALTLVPAGPVYAASEQGMAHGKGKGLTKSESTEQPQAQDQTTTVTEASFNSENPTPTQAQDNESVKTEASTKQNTSNVQTVTPRGNNGTLKIHEQGTPSATENNDPKVCSFNVEGFGFDAGQTGYLQFTVQGGDKPTGVNAGPYSFGPTNASGFYASQYFSLADGHYKATLYGKQLPNGQLTDIKAKSKVFKVRCGAVINYKTCPSGTVWNDRNSNTKVDPGECVSTLPTHSDNNGQVLSGSTTAKLANTGYSLIAVSVMAAVSMLTAIGLGIQSKKRDLEPALPAQFS